MHFALEITSFVCDRTTRIENEKLRSRGIAMYAYSVSIIILHVNQKSIKSTWAEPFEKNVKVK